MAWDWEREERESDEMDWLREQSDQDWSARWLEAWGRLEAIGVVGPEDNFMSLPELERLCEYLPKEDS